MRKNLITFLILAISIFTSELTFSEQKRDVMLCPFSETVVINDAPPGTHILKLSADGLAYQQQGTQQFIITNIKLCPNGTVTADIGLNQTNYTTITFHDGPYIFMDIKSVTNHGTFTFKKWNPDHIKHYYELNFSSTEPSRG